jgi:hypothetical protein
MLCPVSCPFPAKEVTTTHLLSLPTQITTAVPICHHKITASRQFLHEFSRGTGAVRELQESGRATVALLARTREFVGRIPTPIAQTGNAPFADGKIGKCGGLVPKKLADS